MLLWARREFASDAAGSDSRLMTQTGAMKVYQSAVSVGEFPSFLKLAPKLDKMIVLARKDDACYTLMLKRKSKSLSYLFHKVETDGTGASQKSGQSPFGEII